MESRAGGVYGAVAVTPMRCQPNEECTGCLVASPALSDCSACTSSGTGNCDKRTPLKALACCALSCQASYTAANDLPLARSAAATVASASLLKSNCEKS